MKAMTRGEAAREVGIGIETLRFYERKGLLPEPPRNQSGYRLYHEEAIARLLFIRRGQELGFSLSEILELFDLRVDPATTCGDVKRQVQAKLAQVRLKIRDLQRIKGALERLTDACVGDGPTADCPILDAMASVEKR